MLEAIKKINEVIPNLKSGQRFILGIDGLSRAGKTSITRAIEEQLKERSLPYFILHMDDFIETRKNRYYTGKEEWEEYYYLQWNIENLREVLFKPCKSARELCLPFYVPEKDLQEMKRIELPSNCIIIIEGVFLQRDMWRDYFDVVVYVEASKEKRFQREKETTRRQIDKFQKRYWKAEEFYIASVNPIRKANLVVHN